MGGVPGAGPVGAAMISDDTGRQTKYLPKSALHPTAGTNRSEEKKDLELFAITHEKVEKPLTVILQKQDDRNNYETTK